MSGIEKAYRQLYEYHYPPMRVLSELGGSVPRAFYSAAELIININLHRAVNSDTIDKESVQNLVDTAKKWQVELDAEGISYDFKINLEKMMAALAANPADADNLKSLLAAASLARSLPFPVDLWKVQNLYWGMLQSSYPEFKSKAEHNDQQAAALVEDFTSLGKTLSIRIE
jgi:hypothetical protein